MPASSHLPVPHAVAAALLLACLALPPALTPAAAQEAAPAAGQQRDYDLPGGPLAGTLNRIAREAGLALTMDAHLLAGRSAPPVRGRFDAPAALRQALQGSGLELLATTAGGYTLRPAAAGTAAAATPVHGADSAALPVIRVVGSGAAATSEGSGSYAGRGVTLGKTEQALKDIPQSVTVLTRQFIDDQQLTSMSELMAQAPGVVVAKGDTAYQNFYSRGFRIDNYQIDGSGVTYGASFRPDFDLAMYDRVEVLRGAEGLFSASGEPSGSVNLVRKKPTAQRRYSVSASTGSWANHRVEADLSGPLAFDGRLRGRMVAMLQDREFFYAPSDEKRRLLYGVIETDLTPTTLLTAGFGYQQQKGATWYNGLPRYLDGTDIGIDRRRAFTTDWAVKNRRIRELFVGVEQALGADWTLKLHAARQTFDENNLYFLATGPIDPATRNFAEVGTSYGDSGNHADAVDLHAAGSFALWGRRHQLVAGADWRTSDAHQEGYYTSLDTYSRGGVGIDGFGASGFARPGILGPRSFYPAYGAEQKGVYAKLQLQATDALRVILGGRYGSHAYTSLFHFYNPNGTLNRQSTSRYSDKSIVTPYAGLVYEIDARWSAYASVTEIHKPQANYLQGPPENSTMLDPVRGRNLELGVKGALYDGALNTSLALYRIEREGEAVADSRYATRTESYGSACCYTAQGEVTSQGLDVELSGELARGWQLSAGYTYNQNRNKATNSAYHAVTPRHMFKLWSSYRLPGDLSAWTLGGGVSAQSRQTNTGSDWIYNVDGTGWTYQPFTVRQGGYAVWNLSAQYRINRDWSVALNVKNLFDRTYYQTLGTTRAGNWYGEPRSLALSVRGSF